MSSGRDPIRRPPPEFRRATVDTISTRSPWLTTVTLRGPELIGFEEPEPAASVRLLLPRPGLAEPELPTWTGNEFLDADGQRPLIRTLTPRQVEPDGGTLTVDVVVHESGPMSDWVRGAGPGHSVAVSGPGRGSQPAEGGDRYWIGGDESAIPAIEQVLAALPADADAIVEIEAAHPDARVALGGGRTVRWHDLDAGARPGDALVAAAMAWAPGGNDRVWVAGEAAAVQRIRKHLFETIAFDRRSATIRGYWKLT